MFTQFPHSDSQLRAEGVSNTLSEAGARTNSIVADIHWAKSYGVWKWLFVGASISELTPIALSMPTVIKPEVEPPVSLYTRRTAN